MQTATLDAAADAAFAEAVQNPVRVPRHWIADNATLQTDTYVAPDGVGFRVVCRIVDALSGVAVARVRNYGPDTDSERPWPADIELELNRLRLLYGRP